MTWIIYWFFGTRLRVSGKRSLTFKSRMSSFGVTAGIEQMLKSLTDRGANGCKRSRMSLFDWQTLVAKLFQQNK